MSEPVDLISTVYATPYARKSNPYRFGPPSKDTPLTSFLVPRLWRIRGYHSTSIERIAQGTTKIDDWKARTCNWTNPSKLCSSRAIPYCEKCDFPTGPKCVLCTFNKYMRIRDSKMTIEVPPRRRMGPAAGLGGI